MTGDATAIAVELGTQFRHLMDLAETPGDDAATLLGEEIQALSRDDAQSLLMVAVLLAVRLEQP